MHGKSAKRHNTSCLMRSDSSANQSGCGGAAREALVSMWRSGAETALLLERGVLLASAFVGDNVRGDSLPEL